MAKFTIRRSLAISGGVSALVLSVALLFTNAHNSPLDDLGCHQDPAASPYHCHVGALKGREFASKQDAQRVLASVSPRADERDFAVTVTDDPQAVKTAKSEDVVLPPPPAPAQAVVNGDLLKIISWKLKNRAGKPDFDRIVNVISEADIAILQGLDLDEVGKGPLHITGDLLQKRINEKVCRAWFRNGSGAKEPFGILWRESTVGFVDKSGAIKDRCGEMAVIIPVAKKKEDRAVVSSMFFSKVQRKMFMLGTVDLAARPARPERDIPALFKPLEGSNWPTVVTGDVRHSTANLKQWAFKPSVQPGARTKTENIWSRNAVVVRAVPIDLNERFTELNAKEITRRVSESFPMLAEVALVPEADDKLQSLIVKSKPAKSGAKKESAKREAKARPQESFDEPDDDLEAEANDADADTRGVASKVSPSKKKGKKR